MQDIQKTPPSSNDKAGSTNEANEEGKRLYGDQSDVTIADGVPARDPPVPDPKAGIRDF